MLLHGSDFAQRGRVWSARRCIIRAICLLCCVFAAGRSHAQELYLLAGGQQTPEINDSSYAFSIVYQHNVADHALLSFTWLNEGHVAAHHRDGFGLQGWYRWLSAERSWDAALGVGPYRYYDTTLHPSRDIAINDHGFGVIYSAAVHWYRFAPLILQARYNRVETSSSISTDTPLLGIGYQFESDSRAGPTVPTRSYGFSSAQRNELTLMLGSTIANDFSSPTGAAAVLEYRRMLTPYVVVAANAIDEGEAGDVKRRGVSAQLGLTRRFLGERAAVGLATGPYFARDEGGTTASNRVLGLLVMSAAYDVSPRWHARACWYRTVTTNSRDTDVIVVGLGREF